MHENLVAFVVSICPSFHVARNLMSLASGVQWKLEERKAINERE